ncbi:hypothetical protein IFM89_013591 [Coptis chinensis]|uniref:Uncharacterized protein n=1 Tax=Coptis chinensis TaxID=261450 RepID=A0A835HCY2_9MAGN|nr:hypothetical protein IFM89_013591 [Coptis chinensis]
MFTQKKCLQVFRKNFLIVFLTVKRKLRKLVQCPLFMCVGMSMSKLFELLDSSDNSVRCSCLLFEFAGDRESPSGSKSNDMPVGQNVNDSATTTNNQLETSMQHIGSSSPTKNMHVSGGSNVEIHQSGQELTSTNGIINIDLNDPVKVLWT